MGSAAALAGAETGVGAGAEAAVFCGAALGVEPLSAQPARANRAIKDTQMSLFLGVAGGGLREKKDGKFKGIYGSFSKKRPNMAEER
jgi:hypothetical protein